LPSFNFHRSERLKSRKTISRLFKEGEGFLVYPLRISWVRQEEGEQELPPVQFALSVPKRRFPKAVDRNRIRRRIREAYRLHKDLLYEELSEMEPRYAVMAIYVGKEELPYAIIESATRKWINRFLKNVKN
jgi:ribonuclease P protein component